MADFQSNEIYLLEMYARHQRAQAYIDLLVVDYQRRHRTVYLANVIGADSKVHQVVEFMNDFKTGQIRRAEGNSYEKGHTCFDVVMPDRNAFDVFETRVEDLTHMLVVAKCAKPNIKARQDWQREEDERLAQGLEPRRPPEELILAWDGDIEKQIFRILNDRYNTPMLEEWADYIVQQCIDLGYFRKLTVHCYGNEYPLKAGLLQITERDLENIITEGIQSLDLDFALLDDGRTDEQSVLKDCDSLDTYLSHFASALGDRIQENSQIRFDPTKEKHSPAFYDVNLHANKNGVTGLFPPQADVVMGVAKTLKDEKYCFVVGEMGR
ncbi:hypothetical protein [Alicyclobacillus shizuokensis]|uniref:hypothetical protein n=1 Tax=Alicyclobacillus shizuokensis TaxID=392014 RepID=UPI000833E5CA|nr:hypothetical protein [Alicyclobacillus shizuokensis]